MPLQIRHALRGPVLTVIMNGVLHYMSHTAALAWKLGTRGSQPLVLQMIQLTRDYRLSITKPSRKNEWGFEVVAHGCSKHLTKAATIRDSFTRKKNEEVKDKLKIENKLRDSVKYDKKNKQAHQMVFIKISWSFQKQAKFRSLRKSFIIFPYRSAPTRRICTQLFLYLTLALVQLSLEQVF